MKKKKIAIIGIIILTIIFMGVESYAHSGRTDSQGGHKDNKNASGLGSYHYHCGGNPAHLHENGVCPYSSSSSTVSTSITSSSNESTEVIVTEIKINENIESMNVGDSKKLTVTITPDNATDKNIIWTSSDESVAIVSSIGEVWARKSGYVDITATTSNGKTNTIKINVKEEIKTENDITSNTITSNNTSINSTNITANFKNEDTTSGIIALVILGGVGYWGYKKHKKSKE